MNEEQVPPNGQLQGFLENFLGTGFAWQLCFVS